MGIELTSKAQLGLPKAEPIVSSVSKQRWDLMIKTLKVASSVLLTIAAYTAIAATFSALVVITSVLATQMPQAACLFLSSLISAIGVSTISSIGNPFKVYSHIYKWMYGPVHVSKIDLDIHHDPSGTVSLNLKIGS